MPSTSTLAYGATRAGKTRLLMTMAEIGRVVVSDAEGQIAAEYPDAYKMVLPPVLPASASPEEVEERIRVRDTRFAEAASAHVVVWPTYTPTHHWALIGALRARKLGHVTTLGTDSLTFLFEKLIAAICGISIVHKKSGGGEEAALDPVMAALPDFTGDGVQRAMEKQDWGRFTIKACELVSGTLNLCDELGMHCVMTALEVRRELWDGEPGKGRFIGLQQGPLIQGRQAPTLIPPRFQFLLRLASMIPPGRDKAAFAAFTGPHDGWPAGVRGEAFTALPTIVDNPNLPAMLRAAGLIP